MRDLFMLKLFTRFIYLFVMIFLFTSHGFTQADPIHRFSLQEAVDYALQHNHDLKNSRLGIATAVKQVWEVTASGLPQVSVSARYQHLLDIPTQLIPAQFFGGDSGKFAAVQFGQPHNASYGITATQLVFSGSYFVGLQASRVYKKLSVEQNERTELDVKETVINTYHLILIARKNREVLDTTLTNVRKTLTEVSSLYEEGFVEKLDVKQLKISVTGLENTLSTLDQQIDMACNLLKLQLGLDLGEQVELTDKLETLLPNPEKDDDLRDPFLLQKNVNFRSMKTQKELASLSLANEYTSFLPTVAAFGTIQQDAQRSEFNLFDSKEKWYPTTVVGVQLSWNLFSGSAKIFRIQKARIGVKQAENNLEKAERGLRLQYDQAKSSMESTRKRFINYKSNKALAREIYETTLEKFHEGLSTSLELTQSYNQYLNAEAEYLQGMSEMLMARVNLEKILGIL